MMRKGIPFSNAPGVAYEYSNYGFAILGRIVTRASGTPYNDYVATHILQPLGMRSTTLSPAAVPAGRLAHGYRWEDEQWKEEPQLPDGSFGAMGGMLTSLSDLGQVRLGVPRRLAAARWAGDRARAPLVAPRDAAGLAARRAERRSATRRDVQADRRGIRLRARRVGQTASSRHIVAHSGGLPGFGSRMRWLPEYGVGIIAFGNRTYTGWGPPFAAALTELNETGALRAREAIPAKALVNAREQVTKLILDWDDDLAQSIAAQNLFLDRSIDRRRADIAALRTQSGRCKAASGFAYVENALRGQWILPCERGDLLVSVTLAPTMPPSVQFLEVTPAPPPEEVGRPALCQGS